MIRLLRLLGTVLLALLPAAAAGAQTSVYGLPQVSGGSAVTVNGKTGSSITLAASDVGAATPAQVAAAQSSAVLQATTTNLWAVNLNNQVFYFEGSSITRAPHSSGAAVGAQLPGGGLAGNYGQLLSLSPWAAGHGTYYNDGVDGSTSTSMLARYTAGNSTYGVTVPSAHVTCAAAKTAGNRSFFFVDTTTVNNDQLNSVALATTISNYQAEYAQAHADGCLVVMLLAPGQNFGAGLTVNQDIRNGTIPADMWFDMQAWLPDSGDATFWTASHPTPAGHKLIAANLLRALTADGDVNNGDAGTFATPVAVVGPGGSRVTLGTDGSVTAPGPLNLNGVPISNTPLMTWATAGNCSAQYGYCAQSGQWTPDSPIVIKKIQLYLNTAPAGCSNAGTILLQANGGGGSTLLTVPLANGQQSYSVAGPVAVSAGTVLTVQNAPTGASGCTTYANSFGNTVEYIMQ